MVMQARPRDELAFSCQSHLDGRVDRRTRNGGFQGLRNGGFEVLRPRRLIEARHRKCRTLPDSLFDYERAVETGRWTMWQEGELDG